MPDMRKERLIRLLGSVPCEGPGPETGGCPFRAYGNCKLVDKLDHCTLTHMADHLLDNLDIQTWIPVTVDLPNFYPGKRRKVLVTLEDKCGKRLVTTAKYDGTSNCWYDFTDWRYLEFKVLAWMPRPDAYNPGEDTNGGRT